MIKRLALQTLRLASGQSGKLVVAQLNGGRVQVACCQYLNTCVRLPSSRRGGPSSCKRPSACDQWPGAQKCVTTRLDRIRVLCVCVCVCVCAREKIGLTPAEIVRAARGQHFTFIGCQFGGGERKPLAPPSCQKLLPADPSRRRRLWAPDYLASLSPASGEMKKPLAKGRARGS